MQKQRVGGGKADLPLQYNYSWEAGKDKFVLVRFMADAKIGRRQSRFAPPIQSQRGSRERQVLLHHHNCEARKDKFVLVRFIADGKIGRRQSTLAPPAQCSRL